MLLSMCSDYVRGDGDPKPYLKRIAEAGFDGVQWIHHWNTDFIYTRPEIRQIKQYLKDYNLRMFDLHGTDGVEKRWYSETEYQREAGVEIVKNRIEMTAELGGKVVVMHIPRLIPENHAKWAQLRKSIDRLESCCTEKGIRIAVENGFYDEFNGIAELMHEYDPSYLGICYDCGHGNMGGLGLGRIAKLADRLIALHLHDNNGFDDQHKPIFSGTVDWETLAAVIASSKYDGPLTLETVIRNSGIADESIFLRQEYADSKKLASLVERERRKVKGAG